MASKYWLKLYHEMLDDPKIGQRAFFIPGDEQ
jgi:hypothetical protein